jgi:hypothetical protein
MPGPEVRRDFSFSVRLAPGSRKPNCKGTKDIYFGERVILA